MIHLDIGDVSALTLLEKAKLSDDAIRKVYGDLTTGNAKAIALKILRNCGNAALAAELEKQVISETYPEALYHGAESPRLGGCRS